MKKLITIILFIFSLQIFAQQYQVTKQKNVTLSAQQIEVENKKIEEIVNEYPKEMLKKTIQYYFSIVSRMDNMSKKEKENAQLLSRELSDFFF